MASDQAQSPEEDLTGRKGFAKNLAFAWGGYLVNILAGFIMPRLISDSLGQSMLGIWDFSWSVVSYFGLLQMGLGGSVNRYVARHRAKKDTEALSCSVSTIGLFLKIAGTAALVLSFIAAWWIIPLFGDTLGEGTESARWVVVILGAEVAFSLMLTVYTGIIVGCHRWDIHNGVSALVYLLATAGMIISLMLGGGLVTIALVHFGATVAGMVARSRIARKICPEFSMGVRMARWSVFVAQARFSAKSLIPWGAELLSNQSLNILITVFLGPAILAIYARPRNLVQHVKTLAAKFGFILVPTASSLQAQDNQAEIGKTLHESSHGISCLVIPVLAIFVVFGDELIELWMGPAYVYPGLVLILAMGAFPGWILEPVWSILVGLNQHGNAAWCKLGGAACSMALLWVGLGFFEWDLRGAAMAFAVPQILVDGILIPTLACRKVKVSLAKYYGASVVKPLMGVSPFLGCLFLTEWFLKGDWRIALMMGILSLLVLAATYWIFIIPEKWRGKIVGKLRAKFQ